MFLPPWKDVPKEIVEVGDGGEEKEWSLKRDQTEDVQLSSQWIVLVLPVKRDGKDRMVPSTHPRCP